MAINAIQSCEKYNFRPGYNATNSAIPSGSNMTQCHLLKFNFTANGSVTSTTSQVKAANKGMLPYLGHDGLQLLSHLTEKNVYKQTEFVSSFPMAAKLYKASSDEFRLKKNRRKKKQKKSVLTLPNERTVLPQSCTVSDMNDSEYFKLETENENKAKKRLPKTKKNRNEFEYYDRDAKYLSQVNIDLDCSSTDMIKNFKGDCRRKGTGRYNRKMANCDELQPHDVWAVLRNINQFQFNPSPPLSDDSIGKPRTRKKTFKKNRRKTASVIETCRTEKYYISSIDVSDKLANSNSNSSLDRITVIDNNSNNDNEIFEDKPFNGFNNPSGVVKIKVAKAKKNQPSNKKVTPRDPLKTLNLPLVDKLEQSNTKLKTEQKPWKATKVEDDSLITSNFSVSRNDDDDEAANKQLTAFKRSNSNVNMNCNKDGARFPRPISPSLLEPKIMLSKGQELALSRKQQSCKKRKLRLVTTMPSNTPSPKLTQFEIRKRLANIKFPIVVSGKDQVCGSLEVVPYYSQFDGLDDHIWPFMRGWYKRRSAKGESEIKDRKCSPKKRNIFNDRSKRNEDSNKKAINYLSLNRQIVKPKKPIAADLSSSIPKKKEMKPMPVNYDSQEVHQVVKPKPICQLRDKILKFLYKKTSTSSIVNEKTEAPGQTYVKNVEPKIEPKYRHAATNFNGGEVQEPFVKPIVDKDKPKITPTLPPKVLTSTPPSKVLTPTPPSKGLTPTPPSKGLTPTPPSKGLTPTPPSKGLTPTPPSKGLTPTPPSKGLTPTPPSKGLTPTPPSKVLTPTPPSKGLTPTPPSKGLTPTPPSKGLRPTSPSKSLTPTPPSKVLTPTPPSKILTPTPPSKVLMPAKPQWGKKKWRSAFIDNVIRKLKTGAYYNNNDTVDMGGEQKNDLKEITIQTTLPNTAPGFVDMTPKITIRKKEKSFDFLPGFEDCLPELEIKSMTRNQIAVKHCVTNVVFQFDVCVPVEKDQMATNFKGSTTCIPLSVTESKTKVFKCKTRIIHDILPAEICSIIPKVMSRLANADDILPTLQENDKINLSTISELSGTENLDIIKNSLVAHIRMPPELIELATGKFPKKSKHILGKSCLSIRKSISSLSGDNLQIVMNLLPSFLVLDKQFYFVSRPELLLPVKTDKLTSKVIPNPRTVISSPETTNLCTDLVPYSPRRINATSPKIILENLFYFMQGGLSKLSNTIIKFDFKHPPSFITNSVTVNIMQSIKDIRNTIFINMMNLEVASMQNAFGHIFPVKNIPPNLETAKCIEYIKNVDHTKTRKACDSPLPSLGTAKSKKKRYVRLYKKCKSTSHISAERSSTPLNKINNLEDFFQAMGTGKLLSSAFEGHSGRKILASVIELKSWITDISPRQAMLVLLLNNKKDTPNLVRFRPVILQGIAVNRITRASEMDMEIEVIEREKFTALPEHEGARYLCNTAPNDSNLLEELSWIAKTTASDYQKPFDESSEKLLKDLLEKRKKLNPSYLRVMARYVGLGLLKPIRK